MTDDTRARAEEWARVKNVLSAALGLKPDARRAYVEDACASDSSLRKQVEDLLEAYGRTDDFLEAPAADVFGGRPETQIDLVGRTIGHYQVQSRIGSGAMGEVYAARDDRLDRRVALKRLASHLAPDPRHQHRFQAEARAASALNHPNILTIHDVGDLDGRPFIVSEFVEGETLRARLTKGPLSVSDAVHVASQIAGALAAAHDRGILHRDIKPENVMVRPDGYVKILDFGLAKLLGTVPIEGDALVRTTPGLLVGTPRYMSPEQARGLDVDARSDIWSLGVVLYEMLTARPPFAGDTPRDVIAAILRFEPDPIDEDRQVPRTVVDLLTRLLAKDVERRFPDARTLHGALVDIRAALESGALVPEVRVASSQPAAAPGLLVGPVRLMVLPFRLLPPDPTHDFLRFSLADAVVSALSEIAAITVRSSMLASRFSGGEIDLPRIASEADVNIVLTGTLVSAADRVRVSCELIEAPGGRIVWAASSEAPAADVFPLQDRMVTRIVESLAAPLTVPEQQAVRRDVPANAMAYEAYLRANELARHPSGFDQALEMYLKGLDADPGFAPAWARLGRLYRVIGKYSGQDVARWLRKADEAFGRAMSLNPELSVAQNQYAYLQVDVGRAVAAMVRLVTRARRRRNDADLYAGLVHACRYAGLLNASAAAHRRALELDPLVSTTALQTYLMRGELDVAVDESRKLTGGSLRAMVLALLGREAEAIAYLRDQEERLPYFTIRQYSVALRTLLEGDRQGCLEAIRHLLTIDLPDPEGLYWLGRYLAKLGDPRALAIVEAAIDGGFNAVRFMRWDPWIDPLRESARFDAIVSKADTQYRDAAAAFIDAGGRQVLGTDAAG